MNFVLAMTLMALVHTNAIEQNGIIFDENFFSCHAVTAFLFWLFIVF